MNLITDCQKCSQSFECYIADLSELNFLLNDKNLICDDCKEKARDADLKRYGIKTEKAIISGVGGMNQCCLNCRKRKSNRTCKYCEGVTGDGDWCSGWKEKTITGDDDEKS